MKVRFSAWGSSSSEKGNTYKILEHYIRNEIDGDSPSSTLIWCDLAFTLVVITVLLLDSDATSSTILASTRFVYALTIVELTVFTTIFYRLLPPNRFAAIAARYGETPMVPAVSYTHLTLPTKRIV